MKALQRVQPDIVQSPAPEQQQQSLRAAPAKQRADQEGIAPSTEALTKATAQTADTAAASSDAPAAHPAPEAESGPSIAAALGMISHLISGNLPAVKTSNKDE